jgi:hypothetical protein
MFSKIQVIRILRDQIPGLGLKEAKEIVDKYQLKDFESRVAGAMGKEAVDELHRWAWLYTSKENQRTKDIFQEFVGKSDSDSAYQYSDDEGYVPCDCEDCLRDRGVADFVGTLYPDFGDEEPF